MNPTTKKPNSRSLPDSNREYGLIPPQALEIEEAIIGGCMIQSGVYDEIAHILEPDAFYKESHRRIYSAIQNLSGQKSPVDIMTVTQYLRQHDELDLVGGPLAITQMTSRITSTGSIVYNAYVVYEKYVLREVIRITHELQRSAFADDFDGMKACYSSETSLLDNLLAGKRSDKSMLQVMKDHMVELDARIKKAATGEMMGIGTGIAVLNRYTNGWKPGELIVLAARPSMGKTAVALNLFTKSAAVYGKNTLVFSLEMDDMALADRLICSYGGINPDNLKMGKLHPDELGAYHEASAQLQKLPIYIDDTARADLIHISAIARTKRRKGQCDMIVIDYLQLIESPRDDKKNAMRNREREVAEMSRGLKLLAKELKVPVILLAQLSRAVESRPGTMKRPILSDLRESGSIEQDADLVIFPYRPEYYGIMEDQNGNSLENVMILGIAKNRNGRVGDVFCKYSPDLTRFYDFDYETLNTNPSL